MKEQLSQNTELVIHGVAGAMGSVISTFLLYPLDIIKIEAQTDQNSPMKKTNSQIDKKPLVINFQDYYKGLSADIAGAIVGRLIEFFTFSGSYFIIYEYLKIFFDVKQTKSIGLLKAASIASIFIKIITNPFQVVNTKMIVVRKSQNELNSTCDGMIASFEKIYNQEGLKGFFVGVVPNVLLFIQGTINYLIYEELKIYFKGYKNQGVIVFLSGAFSKFVSTLITYPLQSIRTQIQIHELKKQSLTFQSIVNKIYLINGLKGFYKGIGAKLSQTVLNQALMLYIYEKLYKFIKYLVISVL